MDLVKTWSFRMCVLPRICCVFFNEYIWWCFWCVDKKEWTSKGVDNVVQLLRFWRRRKNWRMLQGKANPIALACRDLTSFFFLLLFFLLSSWSGISSVCVVSCSIRCPKSQIVTQKLHDQRRVLVAILVKGVQLSNSLIKGLKIK